MGYLLALTWLIHPIAWKANSRKFICTIVHKTPSQRREGGFLGHSCSVGEVYMLWWCIKIRKRE
jgi:hypothetical protein